MPEPGHLVITIARQLGSGGSELAQRVARRLGVAYLDRQILSDAAAALGVDEAAMETRCERLQGFWTRLLGAFALAAPASAFTPPPLNTPSDADILAAERDVLRQLAAKGPCVVLGHGGFHLLHGHARLLNVFVHGSEAFRVERVMRYYGAADPEEARAAIARSDAERGEYVAELSGALWEDARNYHLCLDAGALGLDRAEALLTDLAAPLLREARP